MMQAGVIYKCDRALPEACEYDNGSNKRYKWCCISSSVQLFQGWQVSRLKKKQSLREKQLTTLKNSMSSLFIFQYMSIFNIFGLKTDYSKTLPVLKSRKNT